MEVKTRKEELINKDQCSSIKKTSYGSSLFFEQAVKKTNIAIDGVSLFGRFESMSVSSLLDSVCIEYPVGYRVIGGHANENALISYLKLKFTRNGSRLFLNIKAEFCCKLIDYQLHPLWNILLSRDDTSLNETCSAIELTKINRYQNDLALPFICLDTVDEDLCVASHLTALAELTPVLLLQNNNNQLDMIMKRILNQYTTVAFADYVKAIDMVKDLHKNALGHDICAALNMLKSTIPLIGAGRLITLPSLNKLLHQLRLHEGARPSNTMWFPFGTVDKLAQLLEVFYLL